MIIELASLLILMVIIHTLIVMIDNLKDASINSTVNKYTETVSIVTLISGIITLFSIKPTLIVSLPVFINVTNIIVSWIILYLSKPTLIARINIINIVILFALVSLAPTSIACIIAFTICIIVLIISVFVEKLRKEDIIYRKNAIICCKVIFLISMITLICSAVILFGNEGVSSKGITNSDEKETLIKTIVTLIGIIAAFLSGMYTTMKSNKATLSSESLWREELMNVASKDKIEMCDLLRLRASQNYKYANKHNGDDEIINAGYEVRDEIGNMTNDLYNKYIFIKSVTGEETVEISFGDQNTIRNLAIALLKYDYIKRGDNVKLTHYIIRELEEDDEYTNLLNWIKEIDVDKSKKK
jgi:membrane protein